MDQRGAEGGARPLLGERRAVSQTRLWTLPLHHTSPSDAEYINRSVYGNDVRCEGLKDPLLGMEEICIAWKP